MPVIFFDLGQTLVNEWDFINYFDVKFLEILNGFGARIDSRNYQAVRDNVIRNRLIGNGSVRELVIEICKLICQAGYDEIIAQRLEPQINEGQKKLFRVFDDAEETLTILSKQFDLGIIANQTKDIVTLLDDSKISQFLKVKVISSEVGIKKPDPRIFQLAMQLAEARSPKDCIMIGDRLDTDILPANMLGMTTIVTTHYAFTLQEMKSRFERQRYIVSRLSENANPLKQSL